MIPSALRDTAPGGTTSSVGSATAAADAPPSHTPLSPRPARMHRCLFMLLLACGVYGAESVVEQQADATWGEESASIPAAHDLAPLDVPGHGRIHIFMQSEERHFRLEAGEAAFAVETPFSGGRLLQVRDARQRTIASVEQFMSRRDDLFPACLLVVRDSRGRELARSDLARGIRPGFTLREASGAVTVLVASGERRVRWKIRQPDDSALDPRVLWIIAAARTQTFYAPLQAMR